MPRELTVCPSCGGGLRPAALVCEPCGLRIEGAFRVNEFTSLSPEDLHFLRIFVHTEGHIKEMESALGVSYPTVKARLADLRAKLRPPEPVERAESPSVPADDTGVVLRELEAGRIGFGEAMRRIRSRQVGE